jgi:prepilin-type N-terminal cleavage/methylation domain-containing protein
MGRFAALRRPASRGADEGFTLVEVMVALVLFVALSTATVSILIQAMRTVRENSQRVVAANVARTQLEYLRRLGTSGITLGLTTTAAPGIPTDYQVRSTAQWVGLGQQSSACSAAQPGQAYVRVTVDVTSADLSAPVTVNSIIAPPATPSAAGTGAAAISVIDQIGAPVSDVVIRGVDTTHPTNGFTYTTGDDGCIFVPGLTPSASLVVSISRSGTPAYVSLTPTGTSQTVSIAASSLARPTFYFAPAAGITFAGDRPEYPLLAGFPVSWQVNETGASVNPGTVGTTVSGQWPSTSGFSAWAGDCPDADPQGYGLPRESFAFVAGSDASVVLDVRPVKLRGITANTSVTVKHAGSGPGCSSTTLDLGKTDAKGILKVGLPNGAWQVSAGAQTQQVTLTPPAPEADDPTTVVNFTLANLDEPSPSPTPTSTSTSTETPSPSPTETP